MSEVGCEAVLYMQSPLTRVYQGIHAFGSLSSRRESQKKEDRLHDHPPAFARQPSLEWSYASEPSPTVGP